MQQFLRYAIGSGAREQRVLVSVVAPRCRCAIEQTVTLIYDPRPGLQRHRRCRGEHPKGSPLGGAALLELRAVSSSTPERDAGRRGTFPASGLSGDVAVVLVDSFSHWTAVFDGEPGVSNFELSWSRAALSFALPHSVREKLGGERLGDVWPASVHAGRGGRSCRSRKSRNRARPWQAGTLLRVCLCPLTGAGLMSRSRRSSLRSTTSGLVLFSLAMTNTRPYSSRRRANISTRALCAALLKTTFQATLDYSSALPPG